MYCCDWLVKKKKSTNKHTNKQATFLKGRPGTNPAHIRDSGLLISIIWLRQGQIANTGLSLCFQRAYVLSASGGGGGGYRIWNYSKEMWNYFKLFLLRVWIYSTSQKFGHTFSFNGFSLLLFLSTMQINNEDIKTMKEHIWNYVVNKPECFIF